MADLPISGLPSTSTLGVNDLLATVQGGTTKNVTAGNASKVFINTTAKTANYTLTTSDRLIFVDASVGDVTISVPAAAGNEGIVWTVKKIDATGNAVIVDPDATETIDGDATYSLIYENQVISFTSDGSNIRILSQKTEDAVGTGDVVGPASATDNAVTRFDGTTGKLIQNSAVTIDDSGNIATSGTVDGRDVSVDGTKLDGIESGADVTDATNVNAAGAVMESDYSTAHSVLVQQTGTGSPSLVTLSDNQLLGKDGSAITGYSATDIRTLINVEDGADVTDETNVTDALDGAMLTDVGTPASGDLILLQDASDSNILKVAQFSTFGGGGGSSPLTTKGDLYTYDTADARLPIGTDGQILIADSNEATGLKWSPFVGVAGQALSFRSSPFVSVAAESTNSTEIFFKPDGLSMYITGSGTVYQYTLGTAWDVSTASYASKSFSVTAEEGLPQSLFFKPDGLSIYIVGTISDTVYQYTLGTAWDVSTASYASKSFSVTTEDTSPQGLFFKSDGLSMYMVGSTSDTVYQYTLGTAWDVSTASYASKSFSVTTEESNPRSLFFKSDGLSMYMVGISSDTVYQYTLGTAWDISTASYASKSFSVAAEETSPHGLFFKPDLTEMYVSGQTYDRVYQYSLTYYSGINTGDVTVTDSSEIDFTLTGQNITASLIAGSIDETKLDTSVNASLDLADSSVQPGDNVSDLTNDAGYLTAIPTNTKRRAITFVFDGAGSAITSGLQATLVVPYAATIISATAVADQSGSIVVDIWKDSYANYPPTNADSITASAPVTISSATKSQDSTLTGWTTSISAGDILIANVDSASTVEKVTIVLEVQTT